MRIILQAIIVVLTGVVLAAIFAEPTFNLIDIFFVLMFSVMLLLLTLMLKEQTNDRQVLGYQMNGKPLGWWLFLMGLFSIFSAVRDLVDGTLPPTSAINCKLICKIIVLSSQVFGGEAVRWIACGIWAFMGAMLCILGIKLIQASKKDLFS